MIKRKWTDNTGAAWAFAFAACLPALSCVPCTACSAHSAEVPRSGQIAAGVAVLKLPVAALSVDHQSLSSVIDLLRQNDSASISYIQDHSNPRLTLHVTNVTVKDVLDEVTKQAPLYKWQLVNTRIVIFPNAPRFQAVIKGVHIVNVNRESACFGYILYLREYGSQYQDFGVGLGGVWMTSTKNFHGPPLFTTPVTLSETAPVICQLTELLGNDPAACFDMQEVPSDILQLGLEELGPPPILK